MKNQHTDFPYFPYIQLWENSIRKKDQWSELSIIEPAEAEFYVKDYLNTDAMTISRNYFLLAFTCNFIVKVVCVTVNVNNQGITDIASLNLSEDTAILILSNNPSITSIPEGVFQNLSSLVQLQMERINYENNDITRNSFQGLELLEYVSIPTCNKCLSPRASATATATTIMGVQIPVTQNGYSTH